MIYAAILAGGIGNRMGNEMPKQFINIGGKTIIEYTIATFCGIQEFEQIIVLCPKEWVEYTENLISESVGSRVVVIAGGATRNETIQNAIKYIDEKGNLDEDTVLVTHDAVRPFVTEDIIRANIDAVERYGACDTVIPAVDTIVKSENNSYITEIPDRSKLYQGQTPQSFKALKLRSLYESLTEEEKNILTDAAKIYVIKGEPVHLVEGAPSNMKITYPYDILVAESIIRSNNGDNNAE